MSVERIYKDGRMIIIEKRNGTEIVKLNNREATSIEKGVAYQQYLNSWDLPVKRKWVNLPPNMVATIVQYMNSQGEDYLAETFK